MILPGATTSLSFLIHNKTADTVHYEIDATSSDPQITVILSEGEMNLLPFDNGVYIVPIRVGKGTRAGEYSIAIRLNRVRNDSLLSRNSSFTLEKLIKVGDFRKITLTEIKSPSFLRAGDTIITTFLLRNEGNTLDRIQLFSDGEIMGGNSVINLGPSSSQMIQVAKNTLRTSGETQLVSSRLTAMLLSDSAQQWSAFGRSAVYALHPKDKDAFFRFPVEASVSYIGLREQGVFHGGVQGEVFGKGLLSTQKKNILEFHAVTPSPIRFNSFTKYEEYYIDYKDDHYYIRLGDKAYSASYLTEYFRYGRGAELHYTAGKVSVGGFYNRPRFFGDIKDEYHVFSSFKMSKHTEINAGYLSKSPKDSTGGNNNTVYNLKDRVQLPYVSLNSKFLKGKAGVEAEVAESYSRYEDGMGYRLQVQGAFKGLNGNAQLIKTTPGFNGYFKDADVYYGNLNYHSKLWNVSFNYNQDARNIQQDTLYLIAPLRKTYQLGFSYNYLNSGSIAVYTGKRRYEDRLEPKQFDYAENFSRISVNQRLNVFTVNAQSEFARTTNYLTRISGSSSYYTLNLALDKNRISINLYGSYANTTRYSAENRRIFYYGARSMVRIGEASNLSLFYQNDYRPEEYYRNRNLLEFQYRQRLFKQHFLEFSGRYTLQQGELSDKDYLFSIKYTAGMNIPIKKVAEYTTVKGTLRNYGGSHVDAVKVYLGNHSAVTDAMGNFAFKNITPGDYIVDLDANTLAMNDISTVPLPALLKVGNQPVEYNLGLTTTATVFGTAEVQKSNRETKTGSLTIDLGKKDESDGFLVIEAQNGTETYRQICKLNSKFTFTHLRPGDWDFKVYQEGLNKRYKVVQQEFKMLLKPGDKRQMMVLVSKKETKVKFQEGELQISYGNN